MSIELSKSEMARFLDSDTPEILCVRGSWGVGKTYAWREAINAAAMRGKVALSRYAYVSLFGLENVSSVRSAIFDNTVKIENLQTSGAAGIFESFADLEILARKTKGLQGFLPGNWGRSGATAIVDRATFAFVRNQIVCFDDLERSSSSVSVKDVMGLASHLREERGCKIVIILNDEKLRGDDREDFAAQFEKVVDTSIVLEPTSEEVISIAFDQEFEGHDYAKEVVTALGLRNIRVISKIIRIIDKISRQVGLDEHDLRQVIATASLAGWVKYEAGSLASLDQLKSFNSIILRMRSQRADAEPIPEWISKPDAIGYPHSDEVDRVIIDALDKGYLNPELFSAAKVEREQAQGSNGSNEEFSLSWKMYHETLNKSDNEIVKAIYNGMRSNYASVSLLNFNGTVLLFRELGFAELADSAIKEYFEARNFNKSALDEELSLWGREEIDPAIVKHFEELKLAYVDTRDPVGVLVQIAGRMSWDQEDLDLVVGLGRDGLVDALDGVPGAELTRVLKCVMRFVGSEEERYAELAEVVESALRKIEARSSNNARKLRALGMPPAEGG